ncbi:MAG: GNAT family N-acetyltransferase [Acidobacteriota bacterium]|nr:GNAT family N-acetyltransferase [Acidobacteriota bacterium]
MKAKPEWKPLTPATWSDFEALFGARGACGGCWCMTWRLAPKEFKANGNAGNKAAMRALVNAGEEPGVLLYREGRAVAWCAVAPREKYVRLENSRVLAPLDGKPVWSVSCFFVDRAWRGQGLTVEVLNAAVEFARGKGAKIVEGYPQEVKKKLPPPFVWTGILPTFVASQFEEAGRRSPHRPIMRKAGAAAKRGSSKKGAR